jgi:hypothetical protein
MLRRSSTKDGGCSGHSTERMQQGLEVTKGVSFKHLLAFNKPKHSDFDHLRQYAGLGNQLSSKPTSTKRTSGLTTNTTLPDDF